MTTMPESLAEQIISEKIKEWEAKRRQDKEKKRLTEITVHPFLAISRDFGCGEEHSIPLLEKTLGWKVYGRNLLDHLAQRETLSRSFLETLDEQSLTLLDKWVNYLIHSGAILQDDYAVKISKMVKVIAAQESAIILGRGANYILAGKKEGLCLRLTAPFNHRVQNIMALRKLAEKDAAKLVRDTDAEREHYIKRYFGKSPQDSAGFDLALNTQSLTPDMICKTIVMLLKEKGEK
jgi:cytidylate kinase